MDEPAHLLVDKREHVLHLTLNRAEKHNALTPRLMVELAQAWNDFREDDSLRVAILTGAGDQAFCAGADLGRLVPLMTGARSVEDEWDELFLRDRTVFDRALLRHDELHKPIIAAVNGYALAGGTELLLATDLRVAAINASFGLTEVTLGLIVGGGGITRLTRQIAWCQAMEILLVGDRVSAEEAFRIGLVNRVVEPSDVQSTAEILAHAVAANGPVAVRKTKEAALRSSGLSLSDGFAVEDECARAVGATDDAREGPRAFIEKRPPDFVGH